MRKPAYAKTGALISCAEAAQLMGDSVFFHTPIVLSLHITRTRPCNIQQYFSAVIVFIFRFFFFFFFLYVYIFLVFALNIDCGYTLEPPQ